MPDMESLQWDAKPKATLQGAWTENLKVELHKSEKSQNPKDLRILAPHDSYRSCKVPDFFCPGAV
jgi:hypothetical protein